MKLFVNSTSEALLAPLPGMVLLSLLSALGIANPFSSSDSNLTSPGKLPLSVQLKSSPCYFLSYTFFPSRYFAHLEIMWFGAYLFRTSVFCTSTSSTVPGTEVT